MCVLLSFLARGVLADTANNVRTISEFSQFLTYPYPGWAGTSIEDGFPSYFGSNQAEACPSSLRKQCSPHKSDCPSTTSTRCCREKFYCEFPPFEETKCSPQSWFPDSVSIWNSDDDSETPSKISRKQILQRALGWVTNGFEYKWQGDRSGSGKLDSSGVRTPVMGIEACYEGQKDCPSMRYGSHLSNKEEGESKPGANDGPNQGPDCCSFAAMSWNIRTKGSGCLRSSTFSTRIDCMDIQPGDVISTGSSPGNSAAAKFHGDSEDTFPNGAHVMVFREWRDKEAKEWTVYQLGGGWGKVNSQGDETYGANFATYDPSHMWCMERNGVYLEDPTFTIDNGDGSCDDHTRMTETECEDFARSTQYEYKGTSDHSDVPAGCYRDLGIVGDGNFYFGLTDNVEACSSFTNCFCKPLESYMIASSKDPTTCQITRQLTETECKNRATRHNKQYGGVSSCDGGASCVPKGCYLYANDDKYYWNDFGTDKCSDTRKCSCPKQVDEDLVRIDDGDSPSASRCDGLNNDEPLTREQCEALAEQLGDTFKGDTGCSADDCAPKGCYRYDNNGSTDGFYWNDSKDGDCTNKRTCYCTEETAGRRLGEDHLTAPFR